MDQANTGNMSAYYDRQYTVDELQRLTDMSNQDALNGIMGSGGMDLSGAGGGGGQNAYEQMLQRSNKEVNRRRSFHPSNTYRPQRSASLHEPDPRRSSMLEFTSSNGSDLEGFQFDPSPNPSSNGMQRPGNIAQRRLDSQRARRQHSEENLALNTSFQNISSSPFSAMSNQSPYHSLSASDAMGFDMAGNYLSNNMLMGLDFTSNGIDSGSNGEGTPRNAYSTNNFSSAMQSSPVQQALSSQMSNQTHDPGGGQAVTSSSVNPQNMMAKRSDLQLHNHLQNMHSSIPQQQMNLTNSSPAMQMQSDGFADLEHMNKTQTATNLDISDSNGVPMPNQNNPAQQVVPQYRNAYSSSGFDMLGVLMRVAARPKPQINIGAVDMSCAFVVCDVTMHDVPIVYCSDVFERLTAYTRHEILGRNCRFLQAPDGKIKAGIKRKYVDDQSVYRIKKMISARQETQISVINYRKGGQPFMNLLTMIPITWDTDEIKYYVGFQVDLVEQPQSVTNKNPGECGSCVCI